MFFLRDDLDTPAEAANIVAHHVHAHATAGNVTDGFRRRESRHENHFNDFPGRGLRGRWQQTAFHGLAEYAVIRQAATVVADFDDDIAALLAGLQLDAPRPGFAGGDALRRALDAMVQAVAHQVQQRVNQAIDHGLVDFRLLAVNHQLHLFLQLLTHVVHQPRQPVERKTERQHADVHDALLQFTGIAFQLGNAGKKSGKVVEGEIGRELAQHGLRDHQFAHGVYQRVNLGHAHTQRARVRIHEGYCLCNRARGQGLHCFRGNFKNAIVHYPAEYLGDGLARDRSDQFDIPGEITFLGVHLRPGRQVGKIGLHLDLAQNAQFAQDPQRIVSGMEQAPVRTEYDMPMSRG